MREQENVQTVLFFHQNQNMKFIKKDRQITKKKLQHYSQIVFFTTRKMQNILATLSASYFTNTCNIDTQNTFAALLANCVLLNINIVNKQK